MNNSTRQTEGATLFVVVLMVLLLLSVIMAITSQFTLAGRRSSQDQDQTLRAQYATEATVARAQAQMTVLNRILSSGSSSNGNPYGIAIPKGTYSSTVAARMTDLCGLSALPAPSQTTPMCGGSDPSSDIFNGAVPSAARLSLFTNYISLASMKDAGIPVTDSASQLAFWQRAFGGVTNGTSLGNTINDVTTVGATGLLINQVRRVASDSYQIWLTVPDINIKASTPLAVQASRVSMQKQQYVLSIVKDSFSKYALFTNHNYGNAQSESACASNSSVTGCHIFFTDNTIYTGPVHSNQQFAFAYSNSGGKLNGANFKGMLTSAGCPAGAIKTDPKTGDYCSVKPNYGAFYMSSGNTTAFASASSSPLSVNGVPSKAPVLKGTGRTQCPGTYCTQPTFNGGVNPVKWNEDFKQLPPDSSSQITDAKQGGLYLTSGMSQLNLSVDDISVAGGDNQHMQVISYVSGKTTTTLAINSGGQVYIKVGTAYKPAVQATSGTWVDASSPAAAGSSYNIFNGVVYVDSADGIASLRGPGRTGTTPASAPPAIAKFMQMTLASSGSIAITGDIKYEDRPCTAAGVCNNLSAMNALGIYAAGTTTSSTSSDVIINSPDSGAAYSAANDVTIDGILMSRSGSVRVAGYDKGDDHGKVNLTGGIIENYYGAFGTFGGSSGGTGYGRNFVYDPRMGDGLTPPSFPTENTWSSTVKSPLDLAADVQIDINSGAVVKESLDAYNAAVTGH